MANRFAILLLFLMVIGCSPANLLSEEGKRRIAPLDRSITVEQLRHDVLQAIDPQDRYRKGSRMVITATDIWESTIIRWLTPLDENRQRFQARLALYHQGIEFTFLNGDHTGSTIGFDGESYQVIESEKKYKKSATISLYLGPLQNYLEWHQTLIRNGTLKVLGTRQIRNIPYWVGFATQGPALELSRHDQFLVYINQKTHRIDYIEFTLRELMKSYRGVVHYQHHKVAQGMLMPYWIGIADDLDEPSYDHYFEVEAVAFKDHPAASENP